MERASERDGGIAWLASTAGIIRPVRAWMRNYASEPVGDRGVFVMLSVVLLVLGIVAAWLIVNTLMNRASKR